MEQGDADEYDLEECTAHLTDVLDHHKRPALMCHVWTCLYNDLEVPTFFIGFKVLQGNMTYFRGKGKQEYNFVPVRKWGYYLASRALITYSMKREGGVCMEPGEGL